MKRAHASVNEVSRGPHKTNPFLFWRDCEEIGCISALALGPGNRV